MITDYLIYQCPTCNKFFLFFVHDDDYTMPVFIGCVDPDYFDTLANIFDEHFTFAMNVGKEVGFCH